MLPRVVQADREHFEIDKANPNSHEEVRLVENRIQLSENVGDAIIQAVNQLFGPGHSGKEESTNKALESSSSSSSAMVLAGQSGTIGSEIFVYFGVLSSCRSLLMNPS
jgi:hypothetical protein